jgi:hypothetical protein
MDKQGSEGFFRLEQFALDIGSFSKVIFALRFVCILIKEECVTSLIRGR